MNRRGRTDVAIVGGGVVGAACAIALARLDLQVVLVEGVQAAPWSAQQPDLRVYAFAPDNAGLFNEFGLWDSILAARAQPYRRMRVWDAAGGDELVFDADAFARRELGWIVEHGLLLDRLWAALAREGVDVHVPARVESLDQNDDGVLLRLDDGSRIDARIAIAADGSDSTVRSLAGVEVAVHDYAQRGVVAYVASEQPHQDTAWQRFLQSGPLALLPCADDAYPEHARKEHARAGGSVSSIVWTLPDVEAQRVLALDDASFGRELTGASASRLGTLRPLSKRVAFPLRRQLVGEYMAGRVLLLGDAAHVVHPLAGQGVNLGLRDVAGLRDTIAAAQASRADWTADHRLTRWARTRRSENAAAAYGFDVLNRLFSNDDVAATLLRGPLLGLAGKLPPLSNLLWRRAAGI